MWTVPSKSLNLMDKNVFLVPFQRTGIQQQKIVLLVILDKTTIQKLKHVNVQRISSLLEAHVLTVFFQNILIIILDNAKAVLTDRFMI